MTGDRSSNLRTGPRQSPGRARPFLLSSVQVLGRRGILHPAMAAALVLACGSGQGTGTAPTAPTVPTSVPVPDSDVEWAVYREAPGCVLNVMDAPRVITDAAVLQPLLVAFTPKCDPAAAAASFDFARHRLIVERVSDAGYNPNTHETIVPAAVLLDGPELVILIDVPPHCGGDDVGPGFIAIVVPAGDQPVSIRNRAPTGCGYGDGPAPA